MIRMNNTRNPHQRLSIFDNSPGSLLAHLPRHIRALDNRSLAGLK